LLALVRLFTFADIFGRIDYYFRHLSVAIASYCSRQAAGSLLYFALLPSFESPTKLMSLVSGIADVAVSFSVLDATSCLKSLSVVLQSPIIGAGLFVCTYHLDLPFPMDASFPLSISACLCSLVYVCSLFLTVHFRGDFGVISDLVEAEPEAQYGPYQWQYYQQNIMRILRYYLGDIVDEPLRDVTLLLAPPGLLSSYGSKLQSAPPVEMKEV
jgi:hypothetical protein